MKSTKTEARNIDKNNSMSVSKAKMNQKKQQGLAGFVKNIVLFKTNTDHSQRSTSTAATEIIKSVSFAENVSIRPSKPLSTYSEKDRLACWYTEEEMQRIQKEAIRIVIKMESGEGHLVGSRHCTRGLERHTQIGSLVRRRNRCDAISSVLREQTLQRSKGLEDPDTISKLYAATTSSCQLWAHRVGRNDERAAE